MSDATVVDVDSGIEYEKEGYLVKQVHPGGKKRGPSLGYCLHNLRGLLVGRTIGNHGR